MQAQAILSSVQSACIMTSDEVSKPRRPFYVGL